MSTATLYAMQFYSSFYIGFFVFVLILIGLFCSMFNRTMRKRIKIFPTGCRVLKISAVGKTVLMRYKIVVEGLESAIT